MVKKKMRLKNKKIIGILLVLVLVATTSGALADTVVLNPGYITGTLSVTGETVTGGQVDARSTTDGLPDGDFDGHDYDALDGEYNVTVEGNHNYTVTGVAHMFGYLSNAHYQSVLTMGRQDTYVGIGETIQNFNFALDPGYIAPNVTVTGGEIQKMRFFANTNYDPTERRAQASHKIFGSYWDPDLNQFVVNYLDGDESSFPMKPWVTNGETYLDVWGYVTISGTEIGLTHQYIDVAVGETTNVYWNLDLSSSINGSVSVVGETINSYVVKGSTYIDNTLVSFADANPGTQDYSVDVPNATWSVYPDVYMPSNYLKLPTETVVVPFGENVEQNWNINPGYVTGSINLYGAYGNLRWALVYASTPSMTNYAWTRTYTGDYRLILYGGEWEVGYRRTTLDFYYDTPVLSSRLTVNNYSIHYIAPPTTIVPGTTVSGFDFSYDTAMITINYEVTGDVNLSSPVLLAESREGIWPDQVYSTARGQGSPISTTFGEATATVLAGSHFVSAYATVGGSYTKFGEFTIDVDPGDIIIGDVGAPTVVVTQPVGSEPICGDSVLVEGTATDDGTGVASITVNDVIVEFNSTDNQEDPNEVSFSTTANVPVIGKNTIIIVVTDESDNSITIERIVYREICNLPPEITLITGPSDPVALGADYEMTGYFTDPDDGDEHNATWDWGDDTDPSVGIVDQESDVVTGSHDYLEPGVYTITLTVEDLAGESDRATWSQYTIIYDPSGGFVTGGGWIDSPLGAYPEDPDLSGKANFGFVAKYKKDAKVPTGNTEFQFHAGDLNFHSDTYEWLLIAGARAVFKGTGTINGEGSYKFILTAVDGELPGGGGVDKFRIKIWLEDEETGEEIIIYDNKLGAEDDTELDKTTEIRGGNIMIHKKPK